jgi:ATP-dependent DNA ligase
VIEQRTGPDLRAWRPQEFGSGKAQRIVDPLIEPVWIGERVLVHLRAGSVEIVDAAGRHVEDEIADVVAGIASGIRAGSAVLDGYLTHQATIPPPAPGLGEVEVPSAGELTAQLLLGRRTRTKELIEEADAVAAIEHAASPLAFVAVDLLELDGTELLDVPLLERKRLLESAVVEGELLRIGAYVRPPVEAWLGTWRSLGFVEVAYKAANGRYAPGRPSETWATARIPKP